MDEIISLISVTYTTDSIGQKIPTETQRQVWAHINSVSRAEFFSAGQVGMRPQYVAEVSVYDYNGEETAIINDVRYAVYRTYRKEERDIIELYLELKVGV